MTSIFGTSFNLASVSVTSSDDISTHGYCLNQCHTHMPIQKWNSEFTAMRVRKKKNDSASEDKKPPLCGSWSRKQQYSWKEHMGQPQVCHFLNHPKRRHIWKTNKNAVMQLGDAKKRRISQLHLLVYSCQVSSLAICELHNRVQHWCDSSCSPFYWVFVNYISIECWYILIVRKEKANWASVN